MAGPNQIEPMAQVAPRAKMPRHGPWWEAILLPIIRERTQLSSARTNIGHHDAQRRTRMRQIKLEDRREPCLRIKLKQPMAVLSKHMAIYIGGVRERQVQFPQFLSDVGEFFRNVVEHNVKHGLGLVPLRGGSQLQPCSSQQHHAQQAVCVTMELGSG